MVWVIVAIVAVIIVAAGAAALVSRRRTARLRERFGPEYGRTVDLFGDRRAAESELQERFVRRSSFDLRDLDPRAREEYVQRWERAQRDFVDQPSAAIAEADVLVIEVMGDRGYPIADDFEQRAADVSVDHPEVVDHYRAAHGISQAAVRDGATTEDLRQAMVHFRALFSELLDRQAGETTGVRDVSGR